MLATNLPRAEALALDGTDLYVTSLEGPDGGPLRTHLRRVPAGCTAPCVADDLVLNGSYAVRFHRLRRAAPGVLFGLGGNNDLYRIAINGAGAELTLVDTVGVYPGTVVTDRAAYLASSAVTTLHRITTDGANVDKSFATVPPLADAGPGLVHLATDCDHVYGMRWTTNDGDMFMSVDLASSPRTCSRSGTTTRASTSATTAAPARS